MLTPNSKFTKDILIGVLTQNTVHLGYFAYYRACTQCVICSQKHKIFLMLPFALGLASGCSHFKGVKVTFMNK